MELVHVRLCELAAADVRGRAHAQLTSGADELGALEVQRAEAWESLGRRLMRVVKGETAVVRGSDYELVRWYQLTLLRRCLGAGVKQRSREVAALLALLSEAIDGRVERVAGVRHA